MYKSTKIVITITVVPFITYPVIVVVVPWNNYPTLSLLKAIAIQIETSLSDGITCIVDQRDRWVSYDGRVFPRESW